VLLRINTSSGVPIYRQIVDQVKVAVAQGAVARGDRLPSVRQLSEELVINPTTVQRAYLDLENEGVIETRRGQGTFVKSEADAMPRKDRLGRFREHLRNALAEGHRMQLSAEDLKAAFEQELKRLDLEQETRDG
jgi:GntR family transcriptional regulator